MSSLLSVAAIAAKENRKVMALDVGGKKQCTVVIHVVIINLIPNDFF